ncbi:hypothetical protein SAMN04489798_3073 [Pseudomonas arsenicoxydans]|uniref:Integrase n=1 Tax=Pseudomonas arsenicoxydans TaxID=702115 RepID=A0A1H0JXJ7_9PSED|nr:hypothetical protein [Pseudomonas arsenicoxydans]SDO48377.1 hypothetical protein SAMN04489798_3073 [Pseudomonas arsenicoxydans]
MRPENPLGFLDNFDLDLAHEFRKAGWLLNSFDDPVWEISLGYDKPKTLDWRIELASGIMLTDPSQSRLLESLRIFLIVAVHGTSEHAGEMAATKTQRRYLSNAIYIVDILLLNSERFNLSTLGLRGLGENDLTGILHQFSTSTFVSESIYEYGTNLSKFCLSLVDQTPTKQLKKLIKEIPSLADISSSDLELNELEIHPHQIPYVRAALYYHGYYSGNLAAGFHVNSKLVTQKIYKNTLGGTTTKPRVYILSYYPAEKRYRRELDAVPVRRVDKEGITKGNYFAFRSRLNCLRLLPAIGVDAPNLLSLQKISNFMIDLTPYGYFNSVPSPVIFNIFAQATEFHYRYGRTILNAFCKAAKYCVTHKVQMTSLTKAQFRNIIGPEAESIGIKQLGLACRNTSRADTTGRAPRKNDKKSFYSRLRANEGLIELIQTYTGCAQYIIGTLMARRAMELVELPLHCLDKTREWLIFRPEKTSRFLFGERDIQARPIDQLAVDMIYELERMQRYLKKIEYISNYLPLFSSPPQSGANELSPASMFTLLRNFDLLCDYFQTATNATGQRYYVRQHQLRRFFALVFFNMFGLGGINTIRWMLAHANLEQVWNYINQNIDETSLRGARSQYIIEEMNKGRLENYESLADLMREKYGIDDFMLANEIEADRYIQQCLKEGDVTVEPVFFNDKHGQQMKIIVKILRHHSHSRRK